MSDRIVPPSAPLKKGNQILCEDKDGNRRYMGAIEVKHATGLDGKAEWWPVRADGGKKHVKREDNDASKQPPPPPALPTAAEVIEKIKETTSEEEARAVVGDDTRKTVTGALEKHIQRLKAQAEEGGEDDDDTDNA